MDLSSSCALPLGIKNRLVAAREAAQRLRSAPSEKKNQVILELASQLSKNTDVILSANKKDLEALKSDATSAFRDRLTLNTNRIHLMIEGLRQVAGLEDPVGEIVDERTLQNGLKARRVRSPLGVIFMIFESRPNVIIEAFSLAFKSGNVILLRGGKESMRTAEALVSLIEGALKAHGFSENSVWGITDPDRKLVEVLLAQKKYIDVVVPRGGDSLIDFVGEKSKIPVIKNDRGLCHVYVHEDADPKMAIEIVMNAKTQRPGVCNAMETLLIHEKQAAKILPDLYAQMVPLGVEWFGDGRVQSVLKDKVSKASDKSWDTEYLELKMNCRVVSSLDEAIAHIEEHGSKHSEAIVTKSETVAREFENRVDAAAVYWNASTRFTDGFELGLGGELGISTQKLHVRGPVGLLELTSTRWIIEGSGQVRS